VSEGEVPEVGDLLFKYVKGNVGAAIELFEGLKSDVEQAVASADADIASKVIIAVRLGEIAEEVEMFKVIAEKDSLSDALFEAISVLLKALADLNAGRLDDVERELNGLQLRLERRLIALLRGAQAGVRGSGEAQR